MKDIIRDIVVDWVVNNLDDDSRGFDEGYQISHEDIDRLVVKILEAVETGELDYKPAG